MLHLISTLTSTSSLNSPSFVVAVASLSCVLLFAAPWTAARQASLSFTISWSLLRLMSIELMIPSNYLWALVLSNWEVFILYQCIRNGHKQWPPTDVPYLTVSIDQDAGRVLCSGSLKTEIKVLASLSSPREVLRKNVLPNSFRSWQTQRLAAMCWGPCILAGSRAWLLLAPGSCRQLLANVASSTGPSQHGSSLLQGQQERLSPVKVLYNLACHGISKPIPFALLCNLITGLTFCRVHSSARS